MSDKKFSAKTVAVTGILSAEALALSWLEGLLPAISFLPPGVKLGFSNIITMFCIGSVGLPYAIGIVLVKAGFVLLTRGATGGLMSLCGGMLSAIVTYILMKLRDKGFGLVGISVCSATAHNIGQYSAASLLAGANLFVAYLPVLLISGVAMGIVTGTVIKIVLPVLEKQYSAGRRDRNFK